MINYRYTVQRRDYLSYYRLTEGVLGGVRVQANRFPHLTPHQPNRSG